MPDLNTSTPTGLSIFSRTRVIVAACLLIVFATCLAFSWTTRDAMSHLPFLNGRSNPQAGVDKGAPVDMTPWQTAHALANLAVTAEEVELAHDAERLADHEADQAFTFALLQADVPRRPKTDEAKALAKKVDQLQNQVKSDQQRADDLSKSAKTEVAGSVDDDLDIVKAQLALDTDELADAQHDLARAEGDQRAKISQELTAHRAMMRKYDAQVAKQNQVATAAVHQYGSVARRIKAWLDQRTRYDLLQEAMQRAKSDYAALVALHDQLEKRPTAAAGGDKNSRLAVLKSKRDRTQLLSIFDDRIQTEQQLAGVYAKWSAQVQLQHRIVLHLLLQSLALIAFVLLTLMGTDALVRRLIDRPGLDWRRMHTLHVISKLTLQLVGFVIVLLLVFGVPNQISAMLGLVTAGLTVVLQDFIVAFFGWFVLIGRNGMRVGDWVEINGVGGEVTEIGVFRTALLETGNWNDKGRPTGRRVTFINSFAIRGQYFNFSTAGQWLWDEITVNIPSSEDTYLMIEAIHYLVTKETEKEVQMAEDEWRRVTHQSGVGQFSAKPAVDMRPSGSGIDILVRYVTRASDRFEVRNRLYQGFIDVLHKSPKPI